VAATTAKPTAAPLAAPAAPASSSRPACLLADGYVEVLSFSALLGGD